MKAEWWTWQNGCPHDPKPPLQSANHIVMPLSFVHKICALNQFIQRQQQKVEHSPGAVLLCQLKEKENQDLVNWPKGGRRFPRLTSAPLKYWAFPEVLLEDKNFHLFNFFFYTGVISITILNTSVVSSNASNPLHIRWTSMVLDLICSVTLFFSKPMVISAWQFQKIIWESEFKPKRG